MTQKITLLRRPCCGDSHGPKLPSRKIDGDRVHDDEVSSSRGRRAIAVIRWYRRKISPYLGPRCRYYPTCSAYALNAIQRHGLLKGITLGAWRLARCNQFSNGGIDDVPEKFHLSFRGYDSHAGIKTNERESDDDARVKEYC